MGTMKGRSIATRKMSDAHEEHLTEQLGGHKAKGSGNQWHDPIDGRNNHLTVEHAFAWDAKSTLGKSIGLTPEAWDKTVEQAGAERPLMPLRWYADERLKVRLDLVALSLDDFTELLAAARGEIKSKVEMQPPSEVCICGKRYDDLTTKCSIAGCQDES